MRILFVTRRYPPSIGGKQLFSRDMFQALSKKEPVTLVKWGGSSRWQSVVIAMPYLFIRSFFALAFNRRRYDVIYVPDGLLAPMGFMLAKLFRTKLVVTIMGLDITYKNPVFRAVIPRFVRRADAVICISQATGEAAQAAGVPQAKLHIIPLAVNDDIYGVSDRMQLLKELRLDTDSQTLLTVGRLVRRKGVAWFIESVLPGLVKEHPKLIYLVAGDGEDRPNIEAAIERQNLQAHVSLLGRVSGELLSAAYNGADVFIMPNIKVPGDMEGFGLVLLEASLSARPVVAADFEGIKDAIKNGQNGVLVPSGQAAEFHKAISKFLGNKDYAREFGQRSRAYSLEHYRWDTVAEQYVDLFQSLLKQGENT